MLIVTIDWGEGAGDGEAGGGYFLGKFLRRKRQLRMDDGDCVESITEDFGL